MPKPLTGLRSKASSAREETLREAEQDHARSVARADALERALDEARGGASAELLAGIDGVVGTLFDLVDVDHGWEEAFEAAAGAALAAVVVAGSESARTALSRLRRDGAPGAVLALTESVATARASGVELPPGAEPIRTHVRPPGRGSSGARPRPGARHVAGGFVLCRARMVGGDRRGPRPPRPGGRDPRGRSFLVDRVAGPRGRRRGDCGSGRGGVHPGRGGGVGRGPCGRGARRGADRCRVLTPAGGRSGPGRRPQRARPPDGESGVPACGGRAGASRGAAGGDRS